ncbi:MAG: selenocysteine-specific translation elongation factor [Verrucomicrobia bacterium]|nr:selenocysteine-specific translation elongation factor [Verrucomicrobiota bacterium]MDA1087914.1 selenocysteine-specific translation elongation factor [Verrucomicrobiota bacterium]
MATRHYILATAGHVDHGKSALVEALTGTHPDRLPEERARGLTIDLGFAHLSLSCGEDDFEIGLIDVPGHEDFVKNMVAGVGAIDAALLVVAADDEWMPQTEEHVEILTYLGVRTGIIALTKSDLIPDSRRSDLIASITKMTAGTLFDGAPVIPTSVVSGEGLKELKDELANRVGQLAPSPDVAKPRLAVDRVFSLHGVGTVVTGTLSGGVLRKGQRVVVEPGGVATRVRGLQSHNEDLEVAVPATRTALNLPDVESGAGVRRGDVITVPGLGTHSVTVDVELLMSPRLLEVGKIDVRPLRDDSRARLHHGSMNVPVQVRMLGVRELLPGERTLAQLRLESPAFVFAGDRFVVRDWSERLTLAGGIVLDPDASRARLRAPSRVKFLEARAASPGDLAVWVSSRLDRDGAVKSGHLLRKSNVGASQIEDALAELVRSGSAVTRGDFAFAVTRWNQLVGEARSLVEAEHREHPELVGLALTDLRSRLARMVSDPDVHELVIDELCRAEYRRQGSVLRRADHRPELPDALRSVGERLRAALSEKPHEPPSRKDLVTTPAAEKALRFLIEADEAIQICPELVMSTEGYRSARDAVIAHLQEHGTATMSDFRKLLGSTRRVTVPLAERFDRDGVTAREGDRRRLKGGGL